MDRTPRRYIAADEGALRRTRRPRTATTAGAFPTTTGRLRAS